MTGPCPVGATGACWGGTAPALTGPPPSAAPSWPRIWPWAAPPGPPATAPPPAPSVTAPPAGGAPRPGPAAEAGAPVAAAAAVAAQAGVTCDGWGRRLGRHVAAQRAAVAAHDSVAALAADAQSGAARGTGATLTADTDAAQRTGNVRSRGAVQRGALTGDQSRLTGRAADERGVTASAGEATDVAGTSQPPARGKTGLARQTASA